jgi:hypothetical protein
MAEYTYEFIASYTVTTAENNIVFSSIPQTYTDLVIFGKSRITSSASQCNIRFNGDSSAIYDTQALSNNGGSGLIAARETGRSQIDGAGAIGSGNTTGWFSPNEFQIFNYSDSNKYKTTFSFGMASDNGNTLDYCGHSVGLWENTAPITSITFVTNGTAFAVGSGWSIYGIKGK